LDKDKLARDTRRPAQTDYLTQRRRESGDKNVFCLAVDPG